MHLNRRTKATIDEKVQNVKKDIPALRAATDTVTYQRDLGGKVTLSLSSYRFKILQWGVTDRDDLDEAQISTCQVKLSIRKNAFANPRAI